jgi:outer membrane protein assembly factor BamB
VSIAIKTCSTCGQVNPAFHDFCPACGATLSELPKRSAPWTFAARFPPMAEAVNPNRKRRRHPVSDGQGVGLTWMGFILIAIPILISTRSMLAIGGWAAGIVSVLLGFFLMRRDPVSLAQMGWLTNGFAILVLALVGFKVIGTNNPDQPPSIAAAVISRPSPTSTPDWASSPAASTPSASVAMYRGNAAHTGELPGPGITGRPYRVWRFDTAGELYSSPAVANGLVYIGSKTGFIYALDGSTGDERWRVDLGDYIVRSSPAVVDHSVFIGAGYSLYSLNADNGEQAWEGTSSFSGSSSPSVLDGTIYIASQSSSVYAFDVATGKQIWSNQTDGPIFSSPAIAGGVVYVGTDSGKLLAISAKSGQLGWSFKTEGGVFSSPAISGNFVYITSRGGKTYAVDITTHKAKWSYDAGGDASPAVANGLVFVGSADGGLYALDAINGGDPVWLFPTGAPITTSPVIADGIVYVASGTTLYAIDATSGAELWRYAAGYRIDTSPVVVNGFVYIGGRDGYLDAISGDGIT